jgi:hypothetical protein
VIDWIVFTAVGILVAFTAAWVLRPDLRSWIEEPKHRFLENVAEFERQREGK